jgi:hypothetical protein
MISGMLAKRCIFTLGPDAAYAVRSAAGVTIEAIWDVTSSRVTIRTHAAVISAFLFAISGLADRAASEPAAAVPFPIATVHFEQNATDGDKEVVFQVKAETEGLDELIIRSPDGRTVVAFKAPDASTMGMRQFRFETPEPPDFEALKAAFPEGAYDFSGRTTSGTKLVGKSTLNHRLPATATFTKPAPKAENVPVKHFEMSWGAVKNVASYIVTIDQRELNASFMVRLPGSSTSFAVPDGFLVRGTKYKMAIGTVTGEGNISFVETTFTTEK